MSKLCYLDNKANKTSCCGCGACAQACAFGAITMLPDSETFIYPVTDVSKCVNCGACRSACPVVEGPRYPDRLDKPPVAIAALHKDVDIRNASASGGAFDALARLFWSDGCVVFGVGFQNGFKVAHMAIQTPEGLAALRKSKYAQSNTGDVFKQASDALKAGRRVLFSGTPCQISGLRTYLGRNYETLLCVDLVCHGVPSQQLLDMFLEERRAAFGDISELTFRHKKNPSGIRPNSKMMRIKYTSGKQTCETQEKNPFLWAFKNQLIIRPSCAHCAYASEKRIADITIGDFWRIENIDSELNAMRGVSLIIANTQKGLDALVDIEQLMDISEKDFNYAVKSNPPLRTPPTPHEQRSRFFELLLKGDKTFSQLVALTVPMETPWQTLKRRIYSVLKLTAKK